MISLHRIHRRPLGVGGMLEISDHTAPRGVRRTVGWLLASTLLGVALLLCFISYGAAMGLAIGLTLFAIAYMLLIGRWTSRQPTRRDW